MTPEQVGGYILLLCHAWNDSHCSLPDDSGSLAVLSRLGDRWPESADRILACFVNRRGRLYNDRLTEEHGKRLEWIEKSRRGGKASGKVRRAAKRTPAKELTEQQRRVKSVEDAFVHHRQTSPPAGWIARWLSQWQDDEALLRCLGEILSGGSVPPGAPAEYVGKVLATALKNGKKVWRPSSRDRMTEHEKDMASMAAEYRRHNPPSGVGA